MFVTKRILVMGLPGSGKTTFTQDLVKNLMVKYTVKWFNADAVRKEFDDWDFTPTGRLRQVQRMRDLADSSSVDFAICDFVCPIEDYRRIFNADIVIWLDTISSGRFDDTNKLFEQPVAYTYRITDWSQNEQVINQIISALKINIGESSLRSLIKAISWRMLGTIDTFVLSWLITGEAKLALAISSTEVVTKLFLYWLHERLWNKVKWGNRVS